MKKTSYMMTLAGTAMFVLLAVILNGGMFAPDQSPLPTLASLGDAGSEIAAAPETLSATAILPTATSLPSATRLPTREPTLLPQPVAVQATAPGTATLPAMQPTVDPVPVNLSQQAVPNQVVVRFNPAASEQERAAYIEAIGGTVQQEIRALDTVVISVPDVSAVDAVPAAQVVAQSEPDYFVTALIELPPSDPHYDQQWALPVIGVPDAWLEMPADAPQVIVAVIDSGVCAEHPDLAGRVLAGWDFVENDATPQDDFDHGCGVAGIIAANIDDGIGIAGVAPNAQIMPLRVLDAQGIGTYSDVAAAIVYAADNGAQVINLSLGGAFPSTVLESAIAYAVERGVMLVAAAGNTGGSVLYPAAYPDVIAVGSVDPDLQMSSFSSRGPEIGLLAPGRDILTTANGSSYRAMSGTSFAAPHVAGVAAVEMGIGNALTINGRIISISASHSITIQTSTPELIPPSQEPIENRTLYSQIEQSIIDFMDGDPNGLILSDADIQIAEDWAFALAAINVNNSAHGGSPDLIIVIARSAYQGWEVAVETSDEFYALLLDVPNSLMSIEAKAALEAAISPASLESLNAGAQLSLPWATGETWAFTGGPHDINNPCIGCSYTTISSALDFSDNSSSGNNTDWVYPAAPGTVYVHSSCPIVRIDHQNGWQTRYHHLNMSTLEVSTNQSISRTQRIARMGTASCPGYAPVSKHLDFSILNGSQNGIDLENFIIGGWRVNKTTTQYNGTMTRLSDGLVRTASDSWTSTRDIYNDGTIGSGTPPPTGTTTRVSVSSTGEQGNDGSTGYASVRSNSISADGRFVTFESLASNLVPGDTNGEIDVFVHDRQMGQTRRVSVSSTGQQGNAGSDMPSISADGRYVAFQSGASNLVPGDTNNATDIFVHDRQMGQTRRVSVSSSGGQANNWSVYPSISADGRYVAFYSLASNLVPGDTNNRSDVFVHDRQTGQTTRVSVSSTGIQGNNTSYDPSISADGRYVTFSSLASNLVPGDTNGTWDIFVHDRQTGQTRRVSVSSTGQQANGLSLYPDISPEGRYVAFTSFASNLVPSYTNNTESDIFVHDRQTGQTTRVSVSSTGIQGNNTSYDPSISADGRYVAFASAASNLVPGDTNNVRDIFVHDRQTGQTTRVSVSSTDRQGNNASFQPRISADGRYVAFLSAASNLVPGDTNNAPDIFVHDRQGGPPPAPPNAAPSINRITTNTPTLTWGGVSWATGYQIQVSDAANFNTLSSTAITDSATLSYPTDPLPNGLYYWRVRAQRPNGSWGGWSSPDTFVVDVSE